MNGASGTPVAGQRGGAAAAPGRRQTPVFAEIGGGADDVRHAKKRLQPSCRDLRFAGFFRRSCGLMLRAVLTMGAGGFFRGANQRRNLRSLDGRVTMKNCTIHEQNYHHVKIDVGYDADALKR